MKQIDIYILTAFISLFLLAIANLIVSSVKVTAFLSRHDEIANQSDLEEYKTLVRFCMWSALVQKGLLLTASYAGFFILTRYEEYALPALLICCLIILGLALWLSPYEKRARSLRTPNRPIKRDYARISRTWVEKAKPDF